MTVVVAEDALTPEFWESRLNNVAEAMEGLDKLRCVDNKN